MGEIDTKPIEPVQVALSLFGEKGDQLEDRSSSSSSDVEKEKDIEGLERELANYRLQMETKESEHKQVLLQLEHYKKTTEELSALLENSEFERDTYIEEYIEVKNRLDEIDSNMKGMADQLSETAKIREQLSNVLNELKVAQADLLNMETELAAVKESELKAMTQAELMQASANMEKVKTEELLGRISELQRTIQELENQMKQDMEFKERKISDQAFYIEALEIELKRIKLELDNANEQMDEYRTKKENDQVLKQGAEAEDQREHVTISIEEYDSLIRRSENGDPITSSENENEVDVLKKEVEAAMVKIGLLSNRAEQAGTRAEAAEKAKAALEDQIKQWQEQKQRRKAALAALREESAPKRFNPPTFEKLPTKYQPLGKVLNMKF